MRGADLEKTRLGAANLTGADLREANLRKTNLRNANLTYANLDGVDLGRAMFCNTLMPDGFFRNDHCRS